MKLVKINNKLKVIIYIIIITFYSILGSYININHQIISTKYTLLFSTESYIDNQLNKEEISNELLEKNIDIYTLVGGKYYYVSSDEEFLNKQPVYFLNQDTNFFSTSIADDLNIINANYPGTKEELKQILEKILNTDVNVITKEEGLNPLNQLLVQVIYFISLILLLLLFVLYIFNLLKKRNEVFIRIINGAPKKKIIEEVVGKLTIREQLLVCTYIIMSVSVAFKSLTNYTIIYMIIMILIIATFEFILFISFNVFYNQIIKLSTNSFIKREFNPKKGKIFANFFLLIITFLSVAIIPMQISTIVIQINEYQDDNKVEEVLLDNYYVSKTSKEYSEVLENQQVVSEFFLHEYIGDVLYISTSNYLVKDLDISDGEELYLLAKTAEDCQKYQEEQSIICYVNREVFNYISPVKYINVYDMEQLSSEFFINTTNKELAIKKLNESGLDENGFGFFGTYKEFLEYSSRNYIVSMIIEIILVIIFIILQLFALYVYIYLYLQTEVEKIFLAIAHGRNVFVRHMRLIFNIIITNTLFGVIINVITLDKRILIMYIFVLQIISLLLIVFLDYTIIKRMFKKRIRS